MLKIVTNKITEVVQNIILVLVFGLLFELCLNTVILFIVRQSKGTWRNISFFILGKTIRRLHITTATFDLRVGKIGIVLGKKTAVTFRDINITLLEDPLSNTADDAKENQESPSAPDSLDILLDGKLFWLLRKIFPLCCYFQLLSITFLDGTVMKVDLSSVAITRLSEDKLRAEVFLHSLFDSRRGETIHHIGYQLKCDILQKADLHTKKHKITITSWSSYLRLNGLHLYLTDLMDKKNSKNLSPSSNDYRKASESTSEIGNSYVTNIERKIHRAFGKYKAIIENLKIADIKVEDLTISYKHFIHLKISSIQLYMESVDIYSYGVNLEFLPSSVKQSSNYEISISASTLSVDFRGISVVRIPFINNIITTDIISFLVNGIPISNSKIAYNMSIINPSIVVTVHHVIDGLKFFKKYKQTNRNEAGLVSEEVKVNDFTSLVFKNLESLPSFILKPSIWNFSAKLQFSNDEHLAFKFYNIQTLLHKKNKIHNDFENADLGTDLRPELAFIERDPFSKQLSNFFKISGLSLSFVKLPITPDKPIVSVPICGFERIDTFLNDGFDEHINIDSTLRHFTLTLDDLDVLEKVHAALCRFMNVYNNGEEYGAKSLDSNARRKQTTGEIPNWHLKLRLKDSSFSLLLANYLPKLLDPLGTHDLNLSDTPRGVIVVLKESFMTASAEEKKFRVVTASVIRVMENSMQEQSTDVVVTLSNLSISLMHTKELRLVLPSAQFKIDVNIIWLIFFIKSVYTQYTGLRKKSANLVRKPAEETIYHFEFSIGSVLFDATLPQDTPLSLLFEQIHLSPQDGVLTVSTISAFVKSVYVREISVQVPLLNITDFELKLKDLKTTNILRICTSSIRFHTEYHFRFYMIVDNIITMFKSFKQIKLAFSNLQDFQRLRPSQQLPANLIPVELFTDKFLVSVEEDPFEQELGLILKIGVLEQRERLKKLQEFDEQRKKFNEFNEKNETVRLLSLAERSVSPDTNILENIKEEEAYHILLENFSTSWIARYRKAKLKFHDRPCRIIKRKEMGTDRYFYSSQNTNTTGNLVIKALHLKIGAPSFPLANYADFIHTYGKGVPKDRLYTLLLIMGVDIRTGLWELRLRDYPIPAVSFPDTHTTGDIVFGERMPDERSLRTVYVPFVPSAFKGDYAETNSIYGSHIIRTMNSIKIFFNIKSHVASSVPASITWGKSLQPGYTSIMLWFDYLTRPQEDPSPKLGFWDKFRFLVHGRWLYSFSEKSQFHLNIKGSQHPYKIADDGAGLSFCWSGGTTIHIHDSKDPKDLLNIESKQFQLAVRDFTAINKFDKVIMKLAGHVIWKLGLLFEQGDIHKAGDEPRLPPLKPHYEIELVHPSHVSDPDSHDSYSGFRSDFIHMSIGVHSSEKGSSNNLYLAPHSIYHFLGWWNLFHTYTSGPIRQGPLFTDLVQNSMKFGRSLFTITYQLDLEPLTLTHVYRHYTDFGESNRVSFTGLKGKVQSLRIDLHQKRVKLTHTDEKLKKSKPVWKFKMSTGEIDCNEADIRILSTMFDQTNVDDIMSTRLGFHLGNRSPEEPLFPVNERELKDSEWYDYEDYVDLDQVSLESSVLIKLEAVPLLFSPRISYFRKINDDGYVVPYPFGKENSHDCMIGKNHPERTQGRLVRQRVAELEKDIKKVSRNLDILQKSQNESDKRSRTNGKVSELEGRLHELKHRLHITHIILEDLKLSEVAPSIYSTGDSESSISTDASSETRNEDDDSPLLRSTTIESFRSMRQASTLQVNSTYDNRFIVHNIQFKINKAIRQHLFEYASNAFERKSTQFFLTYKSVIILKELLNTALTDAKTSLNDYESLNSEDSVSNAEFIERFEELIRDVPSENFDSVDSYLFRLISPQLQFMSDVEPDKAVILAARDIEMGIIDIMQIIGKSGQRIPLDVDTIVETRYCAVAKDMQLFTLAKEDILAADGNGFHHNGYGMHENSKYWPPWIPLEMCYDGTLLESYVFLRRRSMFFTYTAPNPLFFTDKDISGLSNDAKFRVGFPGLIITSTSNQYCTVYNITQDLLSFRSTFDEKVEKLAKVILADEVRNNLEKLDVSVVTSLQSKVKDLYYTREFLKVHDNSLYKRTVQELTFEIQSTLLELSILMTAIKKNYDQLVSGNKSSKKKLNWHIGTDELIWELYDDAKKPFITIGLGPSKFSRSQTFEGLNSNMVAISSLQCFNQQESSVYLELLAPFEDNSKYDESIPMVEIYWKLGPPVGGIADLERMVVSLQPILFKMDHLTSEKIMNYLFPAKEKSNPIEAPAAKQPAISTVLNSQGLRRSSSRGSVSSARSISDSKDGDETGSIYSSSDISSTLQRKPKKITTSILNQPDENINEMVQRSSTFFNVSSILIKRTTMSVCYKGAHHVLTDVNNLIVKVPNLEYHNKVWSRDEFFAALKKDITKVVVQHLGNIIGNKFVPHKKENKLKASMDISQLLRLETHGAANSVTSSIRHQVTSNPLSNDFENAKSSTNDDDDVKPFFPSEDNSER